MPGVERADLKTTSAALQREIPGMHRIVRLHAGAVACKRFHAYSHVPQHPSTAEVNLNLVIAPQIHAIDDESSVLRRCLARGGSVAAEPGVTELGVIPPLHCATTSGEEE